LAFILNYQILEPQLTLTKNNLNKRAFNSFSFSLDNLKSPDLSALVVDGAVNEKSSVSENIASSFLLTSDLKGYIHNPGYYFSNKDNKTLGHLDLLLLTQGWRRFNWKQIKGEEEIVLKYPIETFLNVKGKVTKSDRSEILKTGTVSLIIKAEDSTTILSTAGITDKGEFMVDSLEFQKKATVSVQGNNAKNQLPVDVTIYPSYIDTLKKSFFIPDIDLDSISLSANTAFNKHINRSLDFLDSSSGVYLKNVTVTAKKISKVDSVQKEYVSAVFEQSDQSLLLDRTNYMNIWQFLNSSVPGFYVNPFAVGGVTNVTFSRQAGLDAFNEDSNTGRFIQFYLNEVPVSADVIDAVNPGDVAIVKVYKGATGFALGVDAGAIAVYTKKGVSTGNTVYDKKFQKLEKLGFAFSREFYNPDYTANPNLNKGNEDNRITLYWNPKIKKGKDGKYLVEFHNNDISKSFKIIIQGLDKNGDLFNLT
jgi:hypothetical protein